MVYHLQVDLQEVASPLQGDEDIELRPHMIAFNIDRGEFDSSLDECMGDVSSDAVVSSKVEPAPVTVLPNSGLSNSKAISGPGLAKDSAEGL